MMPVNESCISGRSVGLDSCSNTHSEGPESEMIMIDVSLELRIEGRGVDPRRFRLCHPPEICCCWSQESRVKDDISDNREGCRGASWVKRER